MPESPDAKHNIQISLGLLLHSYAPHVILALFLYLPPSLSLSLSLSIYIVLSLIRATIDVWTAKNLPENYTGG